MKKHFSTSKVIVTLFSACFLFLGTSSLMADPGHGKKINIGNPGNAKEASRTVEVKLFDNYFEPKSITVEENETVRFVIKNEGQFLHEFNIATPELHTAHQAEMMTMLQHGMIEVDKINHDSMNMEMGGKMMAHDDPNSKLVEPGKADEIVWKFSTGEKLEFACNVPGHYDLGMVGPIEIKK